MCQQTLLNLGRNYDGCSWFHEILVELRTYCGAKKRLHRDTHGTYLEGAGAIDDLRLTAPAYMTRLPGFVDEQHYLN